MRSWAHPHVPSLPGQAPEPVIFDSATRSLRPVGAAQRARLYICGITPYDATHLGHAATYVTFDLLNRALRDAGHEVDYCENVTDIDDPLLERADRDGIDWRDLAAFEITRFCDDMAALRVLPPRDFIGVIESMPQIAGDIAELCRAGVAYTLPVATEGVTGPDVYLDLSRLNSFGDVSGWTRAQMLAVSAERGGDPDRPGKRDALDPLLWRAARPGEPSWETDGLPAGRPGWHIECTTIATTHLGPRFDVQAGGIDLVFPHHEMSAVQAEALHGPDSFARLYLHQEMVGLDGHKMSKSRGNLVLVSRLRRQGVEPTAIRLVLLDRHYRRPWDWHDELLGDAQRRLDAWRAAVPTASVPDATALLAAIRDRLADDLDSPGALRAVDAWADGRTVGEPGEGGPLLADALDACLGIRL